MRDKMRALSIKQPWAWLIVNGYKDIENRSWPTSFRGRVYVHAGKGMTWEEYGDAREFALRANSKLLGVFPSYEEVSLQRGGIVGAVTITGCTTSSISEWFAGEYGFTLAKPEVIPFTPCKGALGFFTPEAQP